MFGIGDQPLVGIDIGSTSVKAALIRRSGGAYGTCTLLNFGMVSLPPDTIVDGEVENPTAISEAIKSLISSEKISPSYRGCVFSVSGQAVIIKKITVPLMSEDDLAESIQQEAEQYIPFDIDDVNVDFQVVMAEGDIPKKGETIPEDDDRQMDVLLVAAKKTVIQEQSDIVMQAGMKPVVVDLDVFALENGYELSYGLDENDTFALVNIGASSTNVNIVENGTTAYTRDLTAAGASITESIQKNMNIGFRDAEKVKLGYLDDEMDKSAVFSAIKKGVKAICEELQSTFDMYHKTSHSRVRRVHLSGGGAMMEGIDSMISEAIGLECDIVNPFKNIKVNSKTFDEEYIETIGPMAAVAIGLALRKLDDK